MSTAVQDADRWRRRARALRWSGGLLIDGRVVPATSDGAAARVSMVSPRDGSTLAEFAGASVDDVDVAVASAREAFEDGRWSRQSPTERGEVLIRWAELISESAEELAVRVALEMGKPADDALAVELRATSATLRWYGQLSDKLAGSIPVAEGPALGLITHEPVGVVGAVVPWNFPLTMASWKLGPALVTGNSVVLKPAEATSISALRLGELGLEAGLPAGVLNVVPGRGPIAGAALGRHPDVDVLAFTGSVGVGRAFLGYSAASNGKRVWPELGGKSASVVLADADVSRAASTTAWGCFYNQGQMCSASSRLVVQRAVADEAIAAAVEQARRMTPGDPLAVGTGLGAAVSATHQASVLARIEAAVAEGASILVGGSGPADVIPGGSYLAPTVLVDVRPDHAIARQEVFGPVLSVLVVDDVDEAVRVANGTEFGLAAAVWTRDLATAHLVARRLRAGTVWVNSFEEGTIAMPFGGVKASGYGRDKGLAAVEKYTDVKSTWLDLVAS